MPIAFIENNDSFSWNVLDVLPFERHEIELLHTGAAFSSSIVKRVDAVVIGPGPLDPERAGLINVVRTCMAASTPLLGICLGHQAIGMACGAMLIRTQPTHGKQTRVSFHDSRSFRTVQGDHQVMRYHSLSLSEVYLPLRVVATTDDGTVMAIEHATLPMAGVQFHPDSYGTPVGRQLVSDFFASLR